MRRRPGDPPGGGGWEYWGNGWIEDLFYGPQEKGHNERGGSWIDWLIGDADVIAHSSEDSDGLFGYPALEISGVAFLEGGINTHESGSYPWPAEVLGACAMYGVAAELSEGGGDIMLGSEAAGAAMGELGMGGAADAAGAEGE